MYANLVDLLHRISSSPGNLDDDQQFLQTHVFAGLNNLNSGFGSDLIYHFSASDFLEVVNRCEKLGVRIIGIECFAYGSQLVGIEIAPSSGHQWARQVVRRYLADPRITVCATYAVDR